MGESIGVIATIINAILFLSVSIYVLFTKGEKNLSHYFFSIMSFFLFLYSIVEALKFTEEYNTALLMARIAPSLLALSLYFFVLFTHYLRRGWNVKEAILLFLPMILAFSISYTHMIDGLRSSSYGWVSMFNMPALAIYYLIMGSYIVLGIANLFILHRYVDGKFKRKILYLIIGSFVVLFLSMLYVLQVIENEYLLPFLNISILILGLIYFYTLISP